MSKMNETVSNAPPREGTELPAKGGRREVNTKLQDKGDEYLCMNLAHGMLTKNKLDTQKSEQCRIPYTYRIGKTN